MGKWFIGARPRIQRIACPWLITRFVDSDAEVIYVEKDPDGSFDTLLRRARAEGGKSIDVTGGDFFARSGTEYPDGRSTPFEMMIETYKLDSDEALVRLSRIVHSVGDAPNFKQPSAACLLAITLGGLEVERDDRELMRKQMFVYDALYAWCQVFPEGNYS